MKGLKGVVLLLGLFHGEIQAQLTQVYVQNLTELEAIGRSGSQEKKKIDFDFIDLDLGDVNYDQFVDIEFLKDLDPKYLRHFKGLKSLTIHGRITKPLRLDYLPKALEVLRIESSKDIHIEVSQGDVGISVKELKIGNQGQLSVLKLIEAVEVLNLPSDLGKDHLSLIGGFSGLRTLKLRGELGDELLENIHHLKSLEALVLIGPEEIDSLMMSYLSVLPVQWIAFHDCEAEDYFIIKGFPQLRGISFEFCRFKGVFVYQPELRNVIFEFSKISVMSINSQTDSLAIIADHGDVGLVMSSREVQAIWTLLTDRRTIIRGLEGQFLQNLE